MRTQDVVVFRTHLDAVRCPGKAPYVLPTSAQRGDGIDRRAGRSEAVALGRSAPGRNGGSRGALVHAQTRHHPAH